jgi:glucosyl-3-phosphoglycerate synthase
MPAGGSLRTFGLDAFAPDGLLEQKLAQALRTSLVLPARNEEATIGAVIGAFVPLVEGGLLDELVVVDSCSTDATTEVARAAGATVVAASERGKGEAMWHGLRATTGDLVAFCDADVLDAAPRYAQGLLGPLLGDASIQLVKGFYRRPIVAGDGTVEEHGGRVTELTARPLLNLCRPELGQFVQPLAGEWSGRRAHLESLSFPKGYGVEIAVLLDTHAAVGLDGMAQSDLGCRTHSRQSQQALGVMAAEVLGAAVRRLGIDPVGDAMRQFAVDDHTLLETPLLIAERPPLRR